MSEESAGTQPIRPVDFSCLTRAHVLPFAAFIGFSMALQLLIGPLIEWKHPSAPWWRQAPEQWLYPVQSLVVFALLLRFWKNYDFRWSGKGTLAGIVCGIVGIAVWLLPTTLYDRLGLTTDPDGWMKWLGIAGRKEGFDPGIFTSPVAWWAAVILRFFRAMVVVALMEEIFWRGFLMRFLLKPDGDYWNQPFGKASWLSYGVVTAAFVFIHQPLDWPAAFIYGTITYALCVRSKSLGACVAMHATANFLMGLYAMAYGKYGLW